MHQWLGSGKAKNIFKPGKQRAHYPNLGSYFWQRLAPKTSTQFRYNIPGMYPKNIFGKLILLCFVVL